MYGSVALLGYAFLTVLMTPQGQVYWCHASFNIRDVAIVWFSHWWVKSLGTDHFGCQSDGVDVNHISHFGTKYLKPVIASVNVNYCNRWYCQLQSMKFQRRAVRQAIVMVIAFATTNCHCTLFPHHVRVEPTYNGLCYHLALIYYIQAFVVAFHSKTRKHHDSKKRSKWYVFVQRKPSLSQCSQSYSVVPNDHRSELCYTQATSRNVLNCSWQTHCRLTFSPPLSESLFWLISCTVDTDKYLMTTKLRFSRWAWMNWLQLVIQVSIRRLVQVASTTDIRCVEKRS